jgi:N-acyl homoserine lactone hydrolase
MRFLVFACAAFLAACAQPNAPAAQQQTPPSVRLYAMDCGRMHVNDADGFSDDGAYKGQARDLVDPCYLIRHPNGDLLWDTGLPEAIADLPNHTFAMDGETATVAHKLPAQLAQLQLTPADIEFVSISHSHTDHAGNLGLFTHSTWIVDPDERTYMFRPEARADAQSFAPYAAMESVTPRLIEGDGDYDVFGDGSVVIVQAPGHTPGHTVLLVRLQKSGSVLLAGDLWHMAESRAARRIPRFNTDRVQTLASYDKIEALARETGARVIRQHVPEDFAALPAFPAYLD